MLFLLFTLNEVVLRQFLHFYVETGTKNNIGNKITILLLNIATKILQLWLYKDSMCFPLCGLIHKKKEIQFTIVNVGELSIGTQKYFYFFWNISANKILPQNMKQSKIIQTISKDEFLCTCTVSYRYEEEKIVRVSWTNNFYHHIYLHCLNMFQMHHQQQQQQQQQQKETFNSKIHSLLFLCSHKIII